MKITIPVILLFALANLSEGAFLYDSKGKRDPFVPLVGPGGKLIIPPVSAGETDMAPDNAVGAVQIQGILYDPSGNSIAIVNGREVRQGDELVLDTALSPQGTLPAVTIGRIVENGVYIITKTGEILITYQEEGNEDPQE